MINLIILMQTRETFFEESNSFNSLNEPLKNLNKKFNIKLIINHQKDSNKNKTPQFFDYGDNQNITILETELITLSKARNLLLSKGIIHFPNANYFFTIDDDIIIHDIAKFYLELDRLSKSYDFSFASASILFEGTDKHFSNYARYFIKDTKPFKIKKNDHNLILGSALIFRYDLIHSNFRFDEDLGLGAEFGGSEETDIFLTICEHNFKCMYFPSLKIYHPKIYDGQYNFKQMFSYGKGRGYTYKKHLSKNFYFYLFSFFSSITINFILALLFLFNLNKLKSFNHFALLLGKLYGFNSVVRY